MRIAIPHPTEKLSIALSKCGPGDFACTVIHETKIPGGPDGHATLFTLTRFVGTSEETVIGQCRTFLADRFGIEAEQVDRLEAQG